MGIKNLNSILSKFTSSSIYKPILFSDYKDKIIAVDASIYMYKYKSIYGTQWISAFYNFLKSLIGIKCVFVFDNKNCVEEKLDERHKRYIKKQQLKEKIKEIELALENFKNNGIVSDILKTFKPETLKSNQILCKLIGTQEYNPQSLSPDFSLELIEQYLEKSKNTILPIYSSDFETIKNMCNAIGFATITSTIEAEKLCSILCHEKKVDAVMTEDTDAIAYFTPTILCKVTSGKCSEFLIEKVLENIDMTKDQFLDMCILCGTDYNSSLPGIGPMKAYKYIKTYKSLETLVTTFPDIFKTIDYIKLRNIFSITSSNIDNICFPVPNNINLEKILFENNVFYKYKIMKSLLHPK